MLSSPGINLYLFFQIQIAQTFCFQRSVSSLKALEFKIYVTSSVDNISVMSGMFSIVSVLFFCQRRIDFQLIKEMR